MRLHLLALPLAVGCYTPPDLSLIDTIPIVGDSSCAPPVEVRVGCVLDGDTFDLDGCGGDFERIRLLGVDAPEIAHGADPADCWGDEAHDELTRLVDGRTLALSYDQECTGIFGRTLAYAWLPAEEVDLEPDEAVSTDNDAVLINELLIARGYARLYDEEWTADIRLQQRLGEAQAVAEARGLGLWSACNP